MRPYCPHIYPLAQSDCPPHTTALLGGYTSVVHTFTHDGMANCGVAAVCDGKCPY
eukprot:m.274589 g.274589  ORF g.274589 m.274589 type:complete len:55 (+) comp26901_c1_seq1:1530-1694(+)